MQHIWILSAFMAPLQTYWTDAAIFVYLSDTEGKEKTPCCKPQVSYSGSTGPKMKSRVVFVWFAQPFS